MNFKRRCWAEIDLDALRNNFNIIKKAADGAPVMAVVKADAYGHGDETVAKLLDAEGAAAFAIAMPEEGVRLRGFGIKKPILELGYTSPDDAAALAKYDIMQALYSLDYAKKLSQSAVQAGVTVKCHLKLDTGMGRIGFSVRDDMESAVLQAAEACKLPNLDVEGAFMHFCVADSDREQNEEYTNLQHTLFCTAVEKLEKEHDIHFKTVHCCNSAGTFVYPQFHHDMVRAGIILYGAQPSDEVSLDGLKPLMKLKAKVELVKDVNEGDSESYGRTFIAEKPMRVATISVGYADGYPRLLSNRGVFEINGKPARVVGRVCMDQTMVDVTDIDDVYEGDTAVIFGTGACDSIEDIAHKTDTITYEVMCDIARRVPRVYVENGKEVSEVDYLK